MKVSQSATPYLFLLIILIFGIPMTENMLQKKSAENAVVIEVDGRSVSNVAVVDCINEVEEMKLLP